MSKYKKFCQCVSTVLLISTTQVLAGGASLSSSDVFPAGKGEGVNGSGPQRNAASYSIFSKVCTNPLKIGLHTSLDVFKSYLRTPATCVKETDTSDLVDAQSLYQQMASAETQLMAKLSAITQNMPEFQKEYINEITNSMISLANTYNSNTNSRLYASLDPRMIDFMFTLCNAAYYSKNFAKNENNTSDRYRKKIAQLQGNIEGIKRTQYKTQQFRAMIAKMFNADIVREFNKSQRVNQSDSSSQQIGASETNGTYGQNFGVDTKNTQTEQSFHHQQSGNLHSQSGSVGAGQQQTSGKEVNLEAIEIKSLAPNMFKEIVTTYQTLFSKNLLASGKSITLHDVEQDLSRIELEAKFDLIDAERSLKIMSNPQVGEFFAKMDAVFDRLSEGFMPIDVFYRNTEKSTAKKIFSVITKKKENSDANIQGKEFSGIILYKGDTNPQQKMDQLIFAFSGSNSKADWEHNLNGLTQQGTATGVAIGMKVHRGIKDLFDKSIQENGTKLKRWFDQYAAAYQPGQPNKPTLRITLTGHSLGGALAMLMALYIEQNIVPNYSDRINIDVKVYTFGAPPIFTTESAKQVEQLIGKGNIIRVWNIGDPVSNLSLLKKSEKYFNKSLIMALLGVSHAGISVPLANDGNEKMGTFIDGPWSNHMSDRYRNLIYINSKQLSELQSVQLNQEVTLETALKYMLYAKYIGKIKEFVRYQGNSPFFYLSGINSEEFKNILQSNAVKSTTPNKTIENYEDLRAQAYDPKKNRINEPQLGKADTAELKYTHRLLVGNVPLSIRRNSSCEINNLVKQNNVKLRLEPNDAYELSCGCCLSKNYFVSKDDSLVGKLKGLFGKKINTIDEVYKYCLKYCAPLQGKKFPMNKVTDVNAIGRFMEDLGLGKMWLNKSFK